jgi:hypothetical protein
VFVVEQRHGDKVVVPCGWAHCVENIQACLKVAHDTYRAEEFPLYRRVWKL